MDFRRSCLLLVLREGPTHGYELVETLNAFGFGGSDPGALYRALRKLEGEGMVESGWERSDTGPQKRVYTLTDAGVAELDHQATELAEAERRIDEFLARYLTSGPIGAPSKQRRALNGRLAAHQLAVQRRSVMGPRAD
jgi:PadR family transcriptional regulator PadR